MDGLFERKGVGAAGRKTYMVRFPFPAQLLGTRQMDQEGCFFP